MRRICAILVAALICFSPCLLAQSDLPPIEVGLKVPLAGFLSFPAGENVRLEAGAVLPGFSAPLIDFEAMLYAKIYIANLTIRELPVRPYVGGGALFISSLGGFVPGIVGLSGAEFIAPGLPLVVFIEGSAAMPMTGDTSTIVFRFSLGGRYSFSGSSED